MQIVNGYICMNCCDIDKARMGQDPHQSADQVQKAIDRKLDKLAPANFGPAVSFGGSLQTAATAGAIDTPGAVQSPQKTNNPAAPSGVNLLV